MRCATSWPNCSANTTVFPASTTSFLGGFTSANWWPADLGVPSATGAQNDARYAIFPSTRRLVIQIHGVTKIFDTGEHHIGGVQQQQGGGYGSVSFTSQLGTFAVSNLSELGAQQVAETPAAAPAPQHQAQYQSNPAPRSAPAAQAPGPVPGAVRGSGEHRRGHRVAAGLHQRASSLMRSSPRKKAELLGRL